MVAHDPPFQSPAPYYEIAYRKFQAQWDDLKGVESKVTALFTVGSAGLIATLTVMRLREPGFGSPITLWLSIAAMVALVCLIGSVLVAVRPINYLTEPISTEITATCWEYDAGTVQKWIADAYLASVKANRPAIALKEQAMVWAWRACAVESILLAVILIVG